MLKTRIITGVVLIGMAIGVLAIGGQLLLATAVLLGAGFCWEFLRFSTRLPVPRTLQLVAAQMLPGLGYLWSSWPGLFAGTLLATMATFVLAIWNVEREQHEPDFKTSFPPTLIGLVFPGMFAAALVVIAAQPRGALVLSWFLAITATSDTAAYFIGRQFGRERLSPRISPNKTIAGAVGGFAAAVVVAIAAGMLLEVPLGFFGLLSFGALVAIFAQIGDLSESLIKRTYEVKESSDLLPGHGGLLDRLDALLFAAPVAFLLPF